MEVVISILIASVFVALVAITFMNTVWAEFTYLVDLVQRRDNRVFRLTPHWTKYKKLSYIAMAWEFLFAGMHKQVFKFKPKGNATNIAGVVLYKFYTQDPVSLNACQMICLEEVVFVDYKEAVIKKQFGNFIHTLMLKYPKHTITIYCPNTEKVNDIIEAFEFANNKRFNLFPDEKSSSRDKVKRFDITILS